MRIFYIILTILLIPLIALAQNIRGKVADPEGEPLSFANVILLTDSTYVNGTITNNLGEFSFGQVPDSITSLRVSMLGFNDFTAPIAPDMGTITLQASSTVLDEVIVSAKLPQTQLKGRALVTKIEGSILEKAGDAKDLLTRLPLVTRKGESVEVIGRGTPMIYINGRLVRDNKDLEQLNADMIKTVEVITNPGARYDASVGAVIRIRTKRPKGEGFGIDYNSDIRWRNKLSTIQIAKLKYNSGGLEIFGTASYYGGKQLSDAYLEQTTFTDKVLQQQTWDTSLLKYNNFYGKIGFNYMIGENQSFGAYYENGTVPDETIEDTKSIVTLDGEPYDNWDSHSVKNQKGYPKHNANIYYNGTFGKLEIDFNADYVGNKVKTDMKQSDVSENFNDNALTTHSENSNQLLAEKLVLSYPLWQGAIEVGEEYTNSKLKYINTYNGIDIPDSGSEVHENNIAAFAEFQQAFGKVQLSLGLRYEHVNNKSYSDGTLRSDISRTYDNLFPSLSLSMPVKNVSLSFNFSSKTSRPGYYQLDNSLEYINRSTYQIGNPFLKPTKTYHAQLMSMWRYFYTQAAFAHSRDFIFNTSETFDGDPNVRVITFMNVPKYSQMTFIVGAQPQIGCWSVNTFTGFVKQWYKGIYRNEEIEFNKPVFVFNISNTFDLPHGFVISADYNLTTAGRIQNCTIRPANTLDFSVRKSFFNDALSIHLKANNLFKRSDVRPTMLVGDHKGTSFNPEFREFTLTLRYKFNVTRDKYKGTGAGNTEKGRF